MTANAEAPATARLMRRRDDFNRPTPPKSRARGVVGGRVFAVHAPSAMGLFQSLIKTAEAETEPLTDQAGLKHQQR